jgi:hypothetical protein
MPRSPIFPKSPKLPATVWCVHEDWLTDSSVHLFKTEEAAVEDFKECVRNAIDPEKDEADIEAEIEDAVVAGIYEYSNSDDENAENNCFVKLTEETIEE